MNQTDEEANLDRILERATDVLGSAQAAGEWVDKRSATLGATPRELSASTEGTDRVLLHLNGISRHRFA